MALVLGKCVRVNASTVEVKRMVIIAFGFRFKFIEFIRIHNEWQIFIESTGRNFSRYIIRNQLWTSFNGQVGKIRDCLLLGSLRHKNRGHASISLRESILSTETVNFLSYRWCLVAMFANFLILRLSPFLFVLIFPSRLPILWRQTMSIQIDYRWLILSSLRRRFPLVYVVSYLRCDSARCRWVHRADEGWEKRDK